MARKKVNLAWIPNDATRRKTLEKRRKGLLIKVSELSILCDVKACAVIYEPHEGHPEVWPSQSDAKEILLRYKAMPEMEQCKKRVDQGGFLRQQIFKIQEQIKRQMMENRELEMMAAMNEGVMGRRVLSFGNLGLEEGELLGRLVDERLKVVHERVEEMRAMRIFFGGNPNPNPNFDGDANPNPSGPMVLYGSHSGSGCGGGLEEVVQPYFNFGMDPSTSSSSFYPC